jgi:hypothetical protein
VSYAATALMLLCPMLLLDVSDSIDFPRVAVSGAVAPADYAVSGNVVAPPDVAVSDDDVVLSVVSGYGDAVAPPDVAVSGDTTALPDIASSDAVALSDVAVSVSVDPLMCVSVSVDPLMLLWLMLPLPLMLLCRMLFLP